MKSSRLRFMLPPPLFQMPPAPCTGSFGRGVDGGPGLAAVVGGGDEEVPASGEIQRFVVARDVAAEEAAGHAARAARHRLREVGVDHAHGGADVGVVHPGGAVVVARGHVDVMLGALAVHVALVDGVASVDGNRRIGGAARERLAAGDEELRPGGACVQADHAALPRAALGDGNVDRAVRPDLDVAVQPFAVGHAVAFVDEHARPEAGAAGVAALARRGAHRGLRAVIDRIRIDRIGRGKQRRIRAGADGLVVRGPVGRRGGGLDPVGAVVVAEGEERLGAGGLHRLEGAARPLIGEEDRVQRGEADDGGRDVEPLGGAGLGQGRVSLFRRRDAEGVQIREGEDVARLRIEADVEFTGAALGRRACRREEVLVAGNARRNRCGLAKARARRSRRAGDERDLHVDRLAGGRERHHLDGEAPRAVEIEQRGDLGIRAGRRLGQRLLRSVGDGDRALEDVEVVVGTPRARVGPTRLHLDLVVGMIDRVVGGQRHREGEVVAGLHRVVALRPAVEQRHRSRICDGERPRGVGHGSREIGEGAAGRGGGMGRAGRQQSGAGQRKGERSLHGVFLVAREARRLGANGFGARRLPSVGMGARTLCMQTFRVERRARRHVQEMTGNRTRRAPLREVPRGRARYFVFTRARTVQPRACINGRQPPAGPLIRSSWTIATSAPAEAEAGIEDSGRGSRRRSAARLASVRQEVGADTTSTGSPAPI